jgi:hypothetical protein
MRLPVERIERLRSWSSSQTTSLKRRWARRTFEMIDYPGWDPEARKTTSPRPACIEALLLKMNRQGQVLTASPGW